MTGIASRFAYCYREHNPKKYSQDLRIIVYQCGLVIVGDLTHILDEYFPSNSLQLPVTGGFPWKS